LEIEMPVITPKAVSMEVPYTVRQALIAKNAVDNPKYLRNIRAAGIAKIHVKTPEYVTIG